MLSPEIIKEVEKVKSFERLGEYVKAFKVSQSLVENNENNFFLQNLNGYILFKLNNFESSKKHLSKSIELNNNFATSYYLLGLVNRQHNEFEDALENFIKAISLDINLKDAHHNIIKILSSFKPKKNLNNPYVLTNSLLEKINFDYRENLYINDSEVVSFIKNSIEVLKKNLTYTDFPYMQIYRHNSVNLNCDRHFKVFNSQAIIPEFCFECFKIVIEVNNILDLIKLYFVFDNLYVGLRNNRKVMVEQRPNVSGQYKGFVYSQNLQELDEIANNLQKIIKKNIGDNFTITKKRGCTEFSQKYPNYKEIKKDKMMSFKTEWKDKEKYIDGKIYNKNSEKALINKYLSGNKLNDILIIRNWLKFAKANGDKSIDL